MSVASRCALSSSTFHPPNPKALRFIPGRRILPSIGSGASPPPQLFIHPARARAGQHIRPFSGEMALSGLQGFGQFGVHLHFLLSAQWIFLLNPQ